MVTSTFIEALGYVGTAILGVTLLPQVFKTFREKKANDLSLSYLVLQLFANVLFIGYGYFISSIPVIISNGIVSICSSSLIYAKCKFKDYAPLSDF